MDIQLVVARYAEDCKWLLHPRFEKFIGRAIVYNKGDDDLCRDIVTRVAAVVRVANVGKCDQTYMLHLVSGLLTNSLAQYTIFVPGSLFSSCRLKISRFFEIVAFLEKGEPMPFKIVHAQHYEYNHVMTEYKTQCRENLKKNPTSKQHLACIRPYGRWLQHFFANSFSFDDTPYTIKGVYLARRDIVQALPLSLLQNLLQQLSESPQPEVSHYMERTWGLLLYKTLWKEGCIRKVP